MEFKIDPNYVTITPELAEHFRQFGKVITSITTVKDLRLVYGDNNFLKEMYEIEEVLVTADYNTYILKIEELGPVH
ncbi:hypothetical protein ABER75_11535 [Niallia taxi]|uniref:hypothetical protein n=1 Tax=Niallia taxi TaxID=2499688 RepID=UPI002041DE60|nr:hypothetical protein [Niallia taxi]MCM3216725.1 hypothetical protein [Niallia taxi]